LISQKVTYYKDYKEKTYTETVDGVVTVIKHYDKQGNVVYLWYSKTDWERWKYSETGHLLKHSNHKGVILERRFDASGRMEYEKTNEGVTYDRSLKKI